MEEIITHLYSINKEIQSKEVSLLTLATQNKIRRDVFLKYHSLKDTYTQYQKHMISSDESFKAFFQKKSVKLKEIYKKVLSFSKKANQNTIEFKEKVREIQSGQRTANQAKRNDWANLRWLFQLQKNILTEAFSF